MLVKAHPGSKQLHVKQLKMLRCWWRTGFFVVNRLFQLHSGERDLLLLVSRRTADYSILPSMFFSGGRNCRYLGHQRQASCPLLGWKLALNYFRLISSLLYSLRLIRQQLACWGVLDLGHVGARWSGLESFRILILGLDWRRLIWLIVLDGHCWIFQL